MVGSGDKNAANASPCYLSGYGSNSLLYYLASVNPSQCSSTRTIS